MKRLDLYIKRGLIHREECHTGVYVDVADVRRLVELFRLKEKYVEPDFCDPRESGLPYWAETDEGKELQAAIEAILK